VFGDRRVEELHDKGDDPDAKREHDRHPNRQRRNQPGGPTRRLGGRPRYVGGRPGKRVGDFDGCRRDLPDRLGDRDDRRRRRSGE
jgi:hypothetical protein